MNITFYGAVREVTGSMHLMESGDDRILLDCGLHQGKRKDSESKNLVFPFDPAIITNVVLSHAHIDHSGRLPLLTKGKFGGRIICTRATKDACTYLLLDCAHIQESDAIYLNYKTVKSFLARFQSPNGHKDKRRRTDIDIKDLKPEGEKINKESVSQVIRKYNLEHVEPLYNTEDAQLCLGYFEGYPYSQSIKVGKYITCKFYESGHILGSGISIFTIKEKGKTIKIGYTGDIGRFDRPIIKDPVLEFDDDDRDLDLLIMESTYGSRIHEPVEDSSKALKSTIFEAVEKGGSVLIPAFAFGRTQELIYTLHEMKNNREIPDIPIYVDSPLAGNITSVFGEHPEEYDRETHATFLEKGQNPFIFPGIEYVSSVEESMNLMREERPHIVISASGMCESGRILHHLRCKIHDEKNTILIVGYMAQHTLGRKILEEGSAFEKNGRKGPAPVLRILNKEYPLKAKILKLGGFSAHADQNELYSFLKKSNLNIKRIAVVHGEEDQSEAFAEFLKDKGYKAFVPRAGEHYSID